MRIAFYAPMKPPDHPVPSGDRRVARLLIRALETAGHEVRLASRLRSWDGAGAPDRQARLARLGGRLAERLLRRYLANGAAERPAAWLTYHLYYKAPDWIGPAVARGLAIPYLAVEASLAPKRAGGPWDLGHRATLAALDQAAAIVALNPADEGCLPHNGRLQRLAPFLDAGPGRAAAEGRAAHRRRLAERQGLDISVPWLVAVAMMRPGDKLASYRLLAEALGGLNDLPWHLLIVGAGPACEEVRQAFRDAEEARVRFLGTVAEADLPGLMAACDLFAWPAVNEAYGMALLEAQAAGLPAVAGGYGGVPAILSDGETGLVTAPGDAAAFRDGLRRLLRDPPRRAAMARAALAKAAAAHDLEAAAVRLDDILRQVT